MKKKAKKVVKPKVIKMTDEHKSQLRSAAWDTWGTIASECYKLSHEYGERITNSSAIETILEYIDFHGGFDPFALGYSYAQCKRALSKEEFVD
jgi:hypothetical protein